MARSTIQLRLALTSFTEDMRRLGLQPGAVTLAAVRVQAGEEVGRHLGLPATAEVHMVERLRTADGVPMAIERTHLPADLTPGPARGRPGQPAPARAPGRTLGGGARPR